MPKGFRVQVKYFGDNISKPVFCTLHYIISGSARSLTVLLSMMLSVISWLVGLLSYWLLPYHNIFPLFKNIFPFVNSMYSAV